MAPNLDLSLSGRRRGRRLSLRMLGSPAPIFPGFEVDISTRLEDADKPDAVWHRERARRMIQAHPEIKELIGHTPSTALWCVLFTGSQVGLAIACGELPFWAVLLAAYVLGAWININLFMLAHECNHGLVFGKPSWDRWLFTLTSLPMFLPGHHTWWMEHPVHHNDLGARKDFIQRRRRIFMRIRRASPMVVPYALLMLVAQAVRSTLGLVVYVAGLARGRAQPSRRTLTILADRHLISGYERNRLTAWAVLFPALCLGLLAALLIFSGWKALLYLLLSQTFMIGFLHPLMFGMILSNSHFHGERRWQPSASYYGWLNRLTFNFGYHTEHHDLAGIPWSRLPRLRQLAAEFYDDLAQTTSYTALAWKFTRADPDEFKACFQYAEDPGPPAEQGDNRRRGRPTQTAAEPLLGG